MIIDYVLLAYRSARQRHVRSWLTMIGIFIGIAAIVALLSLSSGLQNAVEQQFLKLGTDKLVVQAAGGGFGPPGTGAPVLLTTKDKENIEKVNGVDLAVGRLIRIVQVEKDDEVKYSYAVSLPEDSRERALVIELNNYALDQGKMLEKHSLSDVVISSHMTGDFFEDEITLRDRLQVQGKEFEIVGLLKESGNPQQDHAFILSEDAIRDILSLGDEYDIIAVKTKAGEDVITVAENIKKKLRATRGVEEGKEDFTVETPQQVVATLNAIIAIIQGVLVGIAAISLIVGGIGITNTMYTAVVERTKEIGIMKALGASEQKIQLLFLIESGLLGIAGGVMGVMIGYGVSKSVEYIALQQYNTPLIQASFTPWLLGGALLFSFLVGAGSGVLPARQAAKLKPVEALRG